MNFDNAILMVEEFKEIRQPVLTGLHSVIPYRIGPVMQDALTLHRQAADTKQADLETLKQELGALDIKFVQPTGVLGNYGPRDYETQRMAARLPASRAAHARALDTDNGLSDDPRFKNYIAGGFSFDDTDSDDAWWFIYKDEDVIAHADGKAAYDRAVRIAFADEWENNFFRDYRTALCKKMKDALGQDVKDADAYFSAEHIVKICSHFSETPRYWIYPELDLVLVPRYAPSNRAFHLQPEGTEAISHVEAFEKLNTAGLHMDIASVGEFATDSRTEKDIIDIVPKDWNFPWKLPCYQYLELSTEHVRGLNAAKSEGKSRNYFNGLLETISAVHKNTDMFNRKGWAYYLTADAGVIVYPSPIYRNSRARDDWRLIRFALYPEGMRALTYSEAAARLDAMGDMPCYTPLLSPDRPARQPAASEPTQEI